MLEISEAGTMVGKTEKQGKGAREPLAQPR